MATTFNVTGPSPTQYNIQQGENTAAALAAADRAETAETNAANSAAAAAAATFAGRRPVNGYDTGAAYEFLFDESSGDTLTDVSGQGNDGSLTAAPAPTNITRTAQGLTIGAGGCLHLPNEPVISIMFVIEVPIGGEGAGFINAGGAAATGGINGNTYNRATTETWRINQGLDFMEPRGRLNGTNKQNVWQFSTGHYKVIYRQLAASATFPFSFGGRADTSTATRIPFDMKIAYAKAWTGALTDAQIKQQFDALRPVLARRGIYLHRDDCVVQGDLVGILGQSNPLGRSLLANLSNVPAFDAAYILNVWETSGGADTTAVKQYAPQLLRMGVNQHGENPATEFGVEYGMALRRQLLGVRTRDIYFAKAAVGATSIVSSTATVSGGSPPASTNTWHPDELATSSLYHNVGLRAIWLAEAQMLKSGVGPDLRGVAFGQGEFEANLQGLADLWGASFDDLKPALRADTGYSDLFISIARTSATATSDAGALATVQAAQDAAAAADANVSVFSTDAYTKNDGTHYDAASQILHGEDHSDAIFGVGL